MSMSDPVADLLTRIRNGQRAGKDSVTTPGSRMRENVLGVLEREGYIRGFEKSNIRDGIDEIRIELKYYEGRPVIREINRVSRPGCRIYSKIRDLPKVYDGLGISILSTPQGVLSDAEAREANVGGEILCSVF